MPSTKKPVPVAEALKYGDLDPESARMFFEKSPQAEQEWIETLLTVPNEHGAIVKMLLYPQQRRMLFERTGRDVTIKGRQTRASSLILARNLRPMVTQFGLNQLVMTQDDITTQQFRDRIHHHLADLERAGWSYPTLVDNDDEIVFEGFENHYRFTSGQQKVAGRATSLQIVHLSEVAHYPDQERAASFIGAIIPAVPGYPFGQFDIESTPQGAEGAFYDSVQAARPIDPASRWTLHFFPWWLEPRYRAGPDPYTCDYVLSQDELDHATQSFIPSDWEQRLLVEFQLTIPQLLWRRWQKKEMAKTGVPFEQEYPETLESCFVAAGDNYFASPDGVDHLGWLRAEAAAPLFMKESLPYKGGEVSFYGTNLRIWEPPRPGEQYAGWLDCAGGGLDERSDYTALTVVNASTLRHVATLRLKVAPDEAAPMVVAVMAYYNTGRLGGERDHLGAQALTTIQKLQYPNLWYYIDPSQPRVKGKRLEAWVHPTQARNEILRYFREQVFSHRFLSRDRQLHMEMGAFTWQKVQGRQQLKAAGKGQNDDVLMSVAGATYVCSGMAIPASRQSGQERQEADIVVMPNGLVIRNPDSRYTRVWMR